MTSPRYFTTARLSANDVFKLQYPRYLKGALLAALALTVLLVWLWPGYQPQPYRLKKSEIFEIIEITSPTEVIIPPKPEVMPRVPVDILEADDQDPDALDTIPDLLPIETPVGGWTKPRLPDEGFLPSSDKPVLRSQARAAYPEIARRAGLEGTVVVQVLVGPRGLVERAEIIQGVHPLLDKAALDAAARCQFTPGKQRGVAVPVWVAVPYRFRLN